jgi:hypothetical protein
LSIVERDPQSRCANGEHSCNAQLGQILNPR